MRLIDVDYAQKELTIAEVEVKKNFETDCDHVRDFLNALPTVDAVPVTRCAECDYSSMEGWYCTGCGLMPAHKTFPHEYCSHGNPKEDSNNG